MAYMKFGPFSDASASPPINAAFVNAVDTTLVGAGAPVFAPAPSGGDDTTALNTWAGTLGAGKLGVLLPGTYVTSSTVTIPAGSTITGWGAVVKATTGGTVNIFTVANNTTLVGIEITSTRGAGAVTGGHGVATTGTTGVKILNCNIHAINYHAIDVGAGTTQFLIQGCEISDTYQQGIYLDHCSWGRVISCMIYNTQHGIQWWGGDSGVAADYTAGPQVKHISIVGNTIRDGNATVSAGIWGSLGQYITVADNVIENMTDLGIDLEGTWDSTVTGNTVNEGQNGCFSAVNGCRRVVFSGNTGSNIVWGGAGFRADWGTPTVTWSSTDISIVENQFSSPLAAFTNANGCIQQSTFTENHIKVNSTSDPSGAVIFSNTNEMTISNNRIYVAVGGTGIKLYGGGNCEVVGNKVFTGSDPSTLESASAGILLQYANSTYTCQNNRVVNNSVRNFVKAVYDQCTTASQSFNLIEQNQGTTIARNSPGTYSGVISNNRSETAPGTASTLTTI